MSTFRPNRRAVLAGAAAGAVPAAVPVAPGRARAAEGGGDTRYRWRNVVIGGTGFVTGVMFHPRVRGLAYARTDIGGAYRWDDRAARWTPLLDHLGWDDWNLLGVEAMAVDPAHPDRLYLACGTYAQAWAGNGAILRSDDRGTTWQRTDESKSWTRINDDRHQWGWTGETITGDPRVHGRVYLATNGRGIQYGEPG
ncbi:hypothetical protein SHO565_56860 [Streptomyces sp. HO565]